MTFPSNINYWAVLTSGAAYWIIGSLWFSAIAGNAWAAELEQHGVNLKEPTTAQLVTKLLTSFLANLTVAFGVALIVYSLNITGVGNAILLGLMLGICFSATTIGIAYTWEGRSLKLFLMDAGYPVLGIIACSIILTLWK